MPHLLDSVNITSVFAVLMVLGNLAAGIGFIVETMDRFSMTSLWALYASPRLMCVFAVLEVSTLCAIGRLWSFNASITLLFLFCGTGGMLLFISLSVFAVDAWGEKEDIQNGTVATVTADELMELYRANKDMFPPLATAYSSDGGFFGNIHNDLGIVMTYKERKKLLNTLESDIRAAHAAREAEKTAEYADEQNARKEKASAIKKALSDLRAKN